MVKLKLIAEIACWTYTGERQTTKMRIKYLEAALNQDIQFYDKEIRTSDVVYAMNTDTVTVQEAISVKVVGVLYCQNLIRYSLLKIIHIFYFLFFIGQMGNFIHYMTTFLAGFVVGFTATWKVALVTLVVSPIVIIIGAIYSNVITKLYVNYIDSLLQSGNIVEQVHFFFFFFT